MATASNTSLLSSVTSLSPDQTPAASTDEDFIWLSQPTRESTYASYNQFSDLPAISFDFGADGYTGSCNLGGELLQITAPSTLCGFVSARGDYEDSTASIVARSQRISGGRATFGIKIVESREEAPEDKGGVYERGPMIERGCFNFRWPLNRYALEKDEEQVGSCSVISFVKDRTLYQIMRLEASPLTGVGPVTLETLNSDENMLDISVGGTFQLDCACSGLRASDCDYTVRRSGPNGNQITLENDALPDHQLSLGLWIDGEPKHGSQEVEIFENKASLHYRERKLLLSPGTSRVIVASFALQKRNAPSLSLPSYREIYDYIGVSSYSNNGTSVPWRKFYASKPLGQDVTTSLPEAYLLARCLEKILTANSLPVFGESPSSSLDSSENSPYAITSSLLPHARVHFQDLFWQVRFLVKVDQFFEYLTKMGLGSGATQERRILIRSRLNDTILFLLQADVLQGYCPALSLVKTPDSDHHMVTEWKDYGDSSCYYLLPTIWYVLKHCRHDVTDSVLTALSKRIPGLIRQFLVYDEGPGVEDQVKSNILHWYHHESALKIIDSVYYNGAERQEKRPPKKVIDDLDEISILVERRRVKSRQVAARSLAARIYAKVSYTSYDEECDRLAFLSMDLGVEGSTESGQCLSLAIRRLLSRVRSDGLNPGILPTEREQSFPIPTSSPWELHALCHHSRMLLRRTAMPIDDERIDAYRQRCFMFLTSEASVIPSWERSNGRTLRLWYSSEASCVIAHTLLEIAMSKHKASSEQASSANQKGTGGPEIVPVDSELAIGDPNAEYPKIPEPEKQPPAKTGIFRQDTDTLSGFHDQPGGESLFGDDSVADILKRQTEILESLKQVSKGVTAFNWKGYRPSATYHPDPFYSSLDDSPECFTRIRMREVQLPKRILYYLAKGKPNSHQIAPFSMKRVKKDIPPHSLGFLSVIDIKAPSTDPKISTAGSGYTVKAVGRLDRNNIVPSWRDGVIGWRILSERLSRDRRGSLPDTAMALKFFGLFLDGALELPTPPILDFLPDTFRDQYESWSRETRVDLNDKEVIMRAKEQLHNNLIKVLCDSLVDQDVQYRFFLVQCCTRPLVNAFVYMWHTESLETFDNHLGTLSQFSSSRKDSWICQVTLMYWSLAQAPTNDSDNSSATETVQGFNEGGRKPFKFPPKDLREKKKKKIGGRRKNTYHVVRQDASSIVISTNQLGDFGKTTIISRLIDEPAMERLSTTALEIWNAFIQQPQTARCLVFLVLLGEVCDEMASRYERILKELTTVLGLGTSVLEDEFTWTKSEGVITRLKRILWALEALRIFRDTLTGCLEKILEARYELLAQIHQGPGRRHDALEQMSQSYIEDFEKQNARLSSVLGRIQHKIEQISRYRDGISTVSSLEDNQTSLRQDNNIKKLTWITIAYLPLAFVASLFAIPQSQYVINDNLGLGWFLGILFMLIFGTVLIALFLDPVFAALDSIRALTKSVMKIPSGWRSEFLKTIQEKDEEANPGSGDGSSDGEQEEGNVDVFSAKA